MVLVSVGEEWIDGDCIVQWASLISSSTWNIINPSSNTSSGTNIAHQFLVWSRC